MENINLTVKKLKEIVDSIPTEYNDSPVIVPVVDPDNVNHFAGSFRIVRTVGIVHESGEIANGYALALAPSRDGADISTLLRINRPDETTCERVLF